MKKDRMFRLFGSGSCGQGRGSGRRGGMGRGQCRYSAVQGGLSTSLLEDLWIGACRRFGFGNYGDSGSGLRRWCGTSPEGLPPDERQLLKSRIEALQAQLVMAKKRYDELEAEDEAAGPEDTDG